MAEKAFFDVFRARSIVFQEHIDSLLMEGFSI